MFPSLTLVLAFYTNEEGGMIYPAIAEHLVFTKGISFTWFSKVIPIFYDELDELTGY